MVCLEDSLESGKGSWMDVVLCLCACLDVGC